MLHCLGDFLLHSLPQVLLGEEDGVVDKVTYDLVDIAPVEPDLCEFGCLHLRHISEPGASSSPAAGDARVWKFGSLQTLAVTLTKGASASFASRRAISVFPQPVGPIMRMFLGTISSCSIRAGWERLFHTKLSECSEEVYTFIGLGILCLLHRFLSAFATALLASACKSHWQSA